MSEFSSGFSDPESAIARVELQIQQAEARAATATQLRQQLDAVRGVASNRENDITATVDPTGRLVDLVIKDSALELSGADLTRTILELTRRAGRQAAETTLELSAEAFGAEDGLTTRLRGELEDRFGSLDSSVR